MPETVPAFLFYWTAAVAVVLALLLWIEHVSLSCLCRVVKNVYMAAYWTSDRLTAEQEMALWEELRDTAGIPHGQAPTPLRGWVPDLTEQNEWESTKGD